MKDINQPKKVYKYAYKMIGVPLLPPLISYINLFCAAKSLKKTEAIKPLIEAWVEEQKSKESAENLKKQIATKYYAIFNTHKSSIMFPTFDFYKEWVKAMLEKSGVTKEDISSILVIMTKQYNEVK